MKQETERLVLELEEEDQAPGKLTKVRVMIANKDYEDVAAQPHIEGEINMNDIEQSARSESYLPALEPRKQAAVPTMHHL